MEPRWVRVGGPIVARIVNLNMCVIRRSKLPLCNCYCSYQHRCCAVLGVDPSHQGLQVVLRPEGTLYKRGLAPLAPST